MATGKAGATGQAHNATVTVVEKPRANAEHAAALASAESTVAKLRAHLAGAEAELARLRAEGNA